MAEDRLEELRAREKRFRVLPISSRLGLNPRNYAHEADCQFLLNEIDRLELLLSLTKPAPDPMILPAAPLPITPDTELFTVGGGVDHTSGEFDKGWNASLVEAEERVSASISASIRERRSLIDLRLQALIAVRQTKRFPRP